MGSRGDPPWGVPHPPDNPLPPTPPGGVGYPPRDPPHGGVQKWVERTSAKNLEITKVEVDLLDVYSYITFVFGF